MINFKFFCRNSWRLNSIFVTGKPRCRIIGSAIQAQVDKLSSRYPFTLHSSQLYLMLSRSNFSPIWHHLCLSRPLWGVTICTKYCGSHEFVRHVLLSTRQGTNMTGMPWRFTGYLFHTYIHFDGAACSWKSYFFNAPYNPFHYCTNSGMISSTVLNWMKLEFRELLH